MEDIKGILGLPAEAIPVSVVYNNQTVGGGTNTETDKHLSVVGHYEIPPAVAAVNFDFSVQLLGPTMCRVQADWPGLLNPNPIGPMEGTYIRVLVLSRPGFNITANGYSINITATGPLGEPGITTGFDIGITETKSGNFAQLGFVFET
jgi:hypothetical protein